MNNIVSTRVRFARNLADCPFPANLGKDRKKLMLRIKDTAKKLYPDWDFIDATALTDIQAGAMIEQHLISPEFSERAEGSGLLLSKDRSVCIMINEEDHLRIQVFSNGDDIRKTYEKAREIEENLDKELHFAFSDKLGYLTQSPWNLGTAMRVSVLVHLPMLTSRNAVSYLTNAANQNGLTVRGIYGEGTEPMGALYQISNRITLGYSEDDIIDRITGMLEVILKSESDLAKGIAKDISAQDRIYRAYGILKQARLISSEESTKRLSDLRCGVEAGIIDMDPKTIDELVVRTQPCNIQLGNPENRDIARAELIRQTLK